MRNGYAPTLSLLVPLSVQSNGNTRKASEPLQETEINVTVAAYLYKTLIHAGLNPSSPEI
jgi:hypothetical protein